LGPKNDAETLFTTLPDGTDIRVSKQEVFQRIDACLQQLEACGVSVALMCCSGVFPGFESRMRLIEPSRILAGMAEAALPRGRLGLLTPLPEQVEHLIQQWQRDGVDVVGEAVAPGSDKQAFEVAAGSLAAQAPDLIVMDCMAYTAAERASVRRVYDGPIILAISACGRFIDELVT
jgi:protein AroM